MTTLPNGLRVATETIPFAETTTVGVWINSGSRFETDETNGVAHFLEHILFKGTKAGSLAEPGSLSCLMGACLGSPDRLTQLKRGALRVRRSAP